MATIRLNLDTREFEARMAQLGNRAPRVMVRSLNRAGASARTAMSRAVSKDMGLKVSDVKSRITLREAAMNRLRVTLYASAKRLPLILFGATGPEPSRGRGRGVSVRTESGRIRLQRAFIARMRSGHRGIFERSGAARLPIHEKFGASIAFVFKKHEQVGIDRATEQLSKNLGHELAFEMSRSA